jgi:hypothetical protein
MERYIHLYLSREVVRIDVTVKTMQSVLVGLLEQEISKLISPSPPTLK